MPVSTAKHTPRAIDLADQLKERYGGIVLTSQAAAELRRLHATNADLLEALQLADTWMAEYISQMSSYTISDEAAKDRKTILAAIARATGGAQ